MGWNNQPPPKQPLAYRAYETFAPGAMFERLVTHHEELKLSDEQLRAILGLQRKYRDLLLKHWPRLIKNYGELEKEIARFEIKMAKCEQLLKRRSELTIELETLCITIVSEATQILTKKQHDELKTLCEAEKANYLKSIAGPLRSEFPSFSVGSAGTKEKPAR